MPRSSRSPQKSTARRGDARMSFFALKDSIASWVERGGTLRRFYDQHQSDIVGTYSQFTRNAAHYLSKDRRDAPIKQPTRQTPTVPTRATDATESTQAAGTKKKRGFEFDPNPSDDLI